MKCDNCKFKTVQQSDGTDFCFYEVWFKDLPAPEAVENCGFYNERKAYPTLEELREREIRLEKKTSRRSGNHEPSETGRSSSQAGKAYLEKQETSLSMESILADIQSRKVQPKPLIPYPFDFEDCLLLFERIYENILAKHGKERSLPTGRQVSENQAIINALVKYFSADATGPLNLNKGIYLFGIVGVGKTMIMEACSIFCSLIENKMERAGKTAPGRGFKIYNAKSIVAEVTEYKKPETLKRYYGGNICLDDFGVEDVLRFFGNDMDVIADIIIQRYMRYQATGLITHATSNLDSEEWAKRYGDRIDSRCHEMFNLVRLKGEDKRKNPQLKIKES